MFQGHNRKSHYSGQWLGAVTALCAALLLSSCLPRNFTQILVDAGRSGPRICEAKGQAQLGNLAVSPDGETVAFEFRGGKPGERGGLGLLEWRTGKLVQLPNAVAFPSFSYDGKQILGVVDGTTLAVIDLATLQRKEFPKPAGEEKTPIYYPVFQPGTGDIVYSSGTNTIIIKIFYINRFIESEILSYMNGFYDISNIWFINSDTVVFNAIKPRNVILRDKVRKLFGEETISLSYQLKIGGVPDVFRPDIQGGNIDNHEFISISSSPYKNIFSYIKYIEKKKRSKVNKNWSLEVFKLQGGMEYQMTDLGNYSQYLAQSADGTVSAFGSDPTFSKCIDLYILDMKSGKVADTKVLGRVETEFWNRRTP